MENRNSNKGSKTFRNNGRNGRNYKKCKKTSSEQKFESQRSGNRNQSCDRPYFNFRYLKDLSLKNSEEVMTIIAAKDNHFQELINDDMKPDHLVIVIRILKNICEANFTEMMTKILSQACSTDFLKIIENYVTKLPFDCLSDQLRNKFYYENINRFWFDLAGFFKKVIELIPRTACDKLTPVLQKILMVINSIEINQSYEIDKKLKDMISNMIKDLEDEIKKLENKVQVVKMSKSIEKKEEPPENFRFLSVVPTIEDLLDPNPYLRSCKIENAYDSVEHYLDIQFRLLREDFVQPLRNGIREYMNGSGKKRNKDFRIYKNAKLVSFNVKENNVGIKLFFGKIKIGINWAFSKRFMFGGLLLLSRDDFNTIIFATIVNRDEKDLEQGFVTIQPCEGVVITPDMYKSNFVLLESKIYFEPYFEVLTAMKNVSDKNFPMEYYLIKIRIFPRFPKYLQHEPNLKFKNIFLLPTKINGIWPSAENLGFDKSQFDAFKSAITEEFAIVQGPPGTGKTFLALQIVRTLLENKENWLPYGPIVIVCLTNHALDQFLEGILKYTDSIVRVGSRSKNETLKPYTLMERRKQFHKTKNTSSLLYKKKIEIEQILKPAQKYRLHNEYLTKPDIIVPLSCLHNYCDDQLLHTFTTDNELIGWLIGIDLNSLLKKPVQTKDKSLPEDISEDFSDGEDENMYTDADLLFDGLKFENKNLNEFILPLDILDNQITLVSENIKLLKSKAKLKDFDDQLYINFEDWKNDLKLLKEKRMSIQEELSHHPIINSSSRPTENPRWNTYWMWVQACHNSINERMLEVEKQYRQANSELSEIKQIANLEVMKEFEIIALTTTCAAKIQSSLRALKSPIVLVEEAAEILEAHIVCSLTKHCQHVILIGDHKQLRPKASVYELGTKYNLNISLFERMVKIRGGKCPQLAYQHRMRPQIANLITPSIYDTLYNHKSVLKFENVKGVEKNLFFLNHNNHETSYNNEESWINKHEVEFLIAFAKHLLLQGYEPSDITILCTYTGQLFTFMKEKSRHALLKDVRITTVDNYQGEENKIILLSLVRNNGKGSIGFLKEENRVCVGLSRAREGLYVMGNMQDLLEKNSIWPKIKQVLEEQNAIGNCLKLRCQIHTDQTFEVKKADDFKQCPEGGCLKKCDLLLSCGHTCTSVCHILDREHKNFTCKQNCNKICPKNHPCPQKCYEECKPCEFKVEKHLLCGHNVLVPCSVDPKLVSCPVEVEVTLTDCKHVMKKPCYIHIDYCKCSHNCEIRLPCGHACTGKCHVRSDPDHLQYKCMKTCKEKNINCQNDHTCKKRCYEECEPCFELVDKIRSCGHFFKNVKCSLNIEEIFCERRCKRKLDCGHDCKLKCSEECKNCQTKVEKQSSCGHIVEVKCYEEATPSKCNGKCPKKLPCGHLCTKKCKESCTVQCKVMIKMSDAGLCGHILSVPCYLRYSDPKSPALLKYCQEPCKTELACSHSCTGSCGSCLQGRFHALCCESCRNVFICGHKCEILCNQECQPCLKECELKCVHSKCNRKCGQPCQPCKELCEWMCEHRRCEKLCYELCNVKPCNEPCKKKLKCGHECVGYCGDPCPPLCRICDKDELTEIFFGNEDDIDARFILLPDCGHCIESGGLMQWVEKNENTDKTVEVKTCPKCKTPIRSCSRIMNEIKKSLNDLMIIKEKLFFKDKMSLENKKSECYNKMKNMENDPVLKGFIELNNYFHKLKALAKPVKNNRKQTLNYNEVNAFENILDILIEILEVLRTIKNWNIRYEFIKDQVKLLESSLPLQFQISKQRLEDLQLELRRLHLMVKVHNSCYDTNGMLLITDIDYKHLMNKLTINKRFCPTLEADIIKSMNTSKENFLIERKTIVKALGLDKGHWFKCPNGHYYAIGECGGAMQRAKCIECKATIGGEQHRLIGNNSFAPEIDGAIAPAWPGVHY